jgi:hypothetical protein
MKKYLLIFTLCLGSLTALKAQDDLPGNENQRQEKIKALYVAYITQQLNLTPDEAQRFWPVHTQFESELHTVRPDMPELEKQQAVLNIKKRYQDNFNKILGNNRCERFFRMDGEFKSKLLDRIRKQRMNQRPGQGMGGMRRNPQ